MRKRCTSCGDGYWARWRNESAELCERCRVDVVLCAHCATLLRPPRDPWQLELLPELAPVLVRRVDHPTVEERYWSLRAKATQATRRRYPYC